MAKKKAPAKKAARKKSRPAAPLASTLDQNEIDWSTVRNIPDDDRRLNKSSQIFTYLVDTVGGEELAMICQVDDIPEVVASACFVTA